MELLPLKRKTVRCVTHVTRIVLRLGRPSADDSWLRMDELARRLCSAPRRWLSGLSTQEHQQSGRCILCI